MIFFEAAKRVSELTDVPFHFLSPIRFGNDVEWSSATNYVLASQFVPKEQGMLVFRTECYTTNLTNGASDFMMHQVTPPGEAYWTLADLFSTIPSSNITDQTDRVNVAHIMLDVDNWLLFGGNQYVNLIGALDATPDAATRNIRTTVYGFFIPGEIYERLRNQFEWANMPNS